MAIEIKEPQVKVFKIKIVGETPLIVHKWAEKSKKMMLDKQQKKSTKKQIRNPQEEFEQCMYINEKGEHCFPAAGFKQSAVNACRQNDSIKMTEARGAFQVLGDLIPLDCDDPVMREDMVRIGMGTSDLRYRPMYEEWSATITVKYNADFMSAEQIINLFVLAGFASGLGEWRPSSPKKSGQFGMFRVEPVK